MKRLFLALDFPDAIRDALHLIQPKSGEGLRPVSREVLHLTLCFIGRAEVEQVHQAIAPVQAEAFSLAIKGVGARRRSGGGVLWAEVASCEALIMLREKLLVALRQASLPADCRKYRPHITLARIKPGVSGSRIELFLQQHRRVELGPILFHQFVLFSSDTRPEGAVYQVEHAYPLIRN